MTKKIMILRHAEKPDKGEDIHGVTAEGERDKNDLSPQGWQRSGALIRFFSPLNGQFQHPGLAKPTAIFAAAPAGHAQSLRSEHTVGALARSLNLRVGLKHSKGEEHELVNDAIATGGVVLIAWEHNSIIDVANLILGNKKSSPQHWPDSRFDLVWVFDEEVPHAPWKFSQIPQMLLPTDKDDII